MSTTDNNNSDNTVRQHPIVSWMLSRRDELQIEGTLLSINYNKIIGWADEDVNLNYYDIETVKSSTSFLGWLLGYGSIEITLRTGHKISLDYYPEHVEIAKYIMEPVETAKKSRQGFTFINPQNEQ